MFSKSNAFANWRVTLQASQSPQNGSMLPTWIDDLTIKAVPESQSPLIGSIFRTKTVTAAIRGGNSSLNPL